MRSGWRVIHVLTSTAMIFAACAKPNPAVCCLSPADCDSLGITDTSAQTCSDGFVCVDHGCTTAPPIDAPTPQCTVDTDCPASIPHCSSSKTCVGCIDSSQCSAADPVCDTETMSCRTCAKDADCGSDVCDVDAGTCTPSSLVLYASSTGSAGSNCDQMSPCTLDRAVALADATRYIIRLTPGSYTGNEAITKQISIEGTGSTLAAATVNGTALDLRNGAVLAVIGLTINAPTASTGGVLCSGGTLVLSHVTIDSAVSGLAANPPSGSCTVTVEQSVVKTQSTSQPAIITTTNTVLNIDRSLIDGGDGIQSFASSAQIQIKNTIFRNQSATDGAFVGLGHFTVDFSTFVDAPLKCVSNSSVTISDSVLWAAGQNAVIGTGVGCIVSSSLVDVDPLFQDAANGNFSLKAGSPAIDAAPANATVPPVDFVGTTRPQGPRADLGAYEYKP